MGIIVGGLPVVVAGAILVLTIAIPASVLINLTYRLLATHSLPPNLPWVGVSSHSGALGRARANLASFFGLKFLLDEGYEKYSKNDTPYVLPYYINGPQVVLPLSNIRWLLEQPDSVLSQDQVNRQFLESEHTFQHASLVKDPVHPEIIKYELTRQIGTFTDDIVEEMKTCIEEVWGSDTENWREIRVYDTMLDVITRLSTRAFMGLPLCRNAIFLKTCQSFNRNVIISAAILSTLPSVLKPIFAPVVTFYDYIQYWKCSQFVMPIIKKRLSKIQHTRKQPLFGTESPKDYIQWAINHAVAKPAPNPLELDPRVIACRFSVLCFAAIQSSVITLTNAIFDLAASPAGAAALDALRAEALRETSKPSIHTTTTTTTTIGGDDDVDTTRAAAAVWDKAALARMRRVDSALRESLRLHGFVERGVMKLVVAPGGVTLPDGRTHLPRGTKVGVSGYSIHHDGDLYPDAGRYEPFRFAAAGDGDGAVDGGERPLALVSTSERFMGFSHGSHACPGRFFAANQLKIALAHIAMYYEIEPIPERPVNKWFFGHVAPPLTETLRVRRRKT